MPGRLKQDGTKYKLIISSEDGAGEPMSAVFSWDKEAQAFVLKSNSKVIQTAFAGAYTGLAELRAVTPNRKIAVVA